MNPFESLLLGNSPQLREAVNVAAVVAGTDITTLITGESGTGKELFARGLHLASRRAAGPFVSINCASLPEALAESLLFGHRKGAFTGALSHHAGYVRSAQRGSLFLDEIAELPQSVQAKLLRFLESGECLPVGEVSAQAADVRVIAATHRDLREEVRLGRFREDLLFRLDVVPLTLPPLRERSGDLRLLLQHFIGEAAKRYGLAPPLVGGPAMRTLQAYHWPGNVRELRNLAERLVVLSSGREVTADNLPAEMRQGPVTPDRGFRLPDQGVVLEELEADIIRQALQRTRGNRSRAARLLGLSRDTLLYRVKKYAIG